MDRQAPLGSFEYHSETKRLYLDPCDRKPSVEHCVGKLLARSTTRSHWHGQNTSSCSHFTTSSCFDMVDLYKAIYWAPALGLLARLGIEWARLRRNALQSEAACACGKDIFDGWRFKLELAVAVANTWPCCGPTVAVPWQWRCPPLGLR